MAAMVVAMVGLMLAILSVGVGIIRWVRATGRGN